ncbi:MAG TPA: HAD-IA family hydrolase [Acidobacteriaceae bacterium]|nr:HAD-IA family hydrolase [Acidobacteriaceae bacterium]
MDSFPAAGVVTLHPRGILFDMDGVLVSSLGSVERSWEKWAVSRGVDPDVAIRTAHGRRAIETVRMLRPDLDAMQELQWIEEMEVADNVGLEILAGVERILATLPEKYWTVVTSATERLARSRMEAGGIRVPARIISADGVTQGKPHPEPYRKGAELLGLTPPECLVIEDSASGAKAGHAAGCKVLATLHSHSVASLQDADWIVQSLDDVHVNVAHHALEVRFAPIERPVAVNLVQAHP